MGKPITIDVQAKLALKNQTDVIKGFVDDIDSAFGDLDISDALRASFDKSLAGINKTFAKTQSLFGKSIFNEKDLKKSATYIDSIATALAGIEYKVKTSTAESLGLGSKELAQARKELKTLNQERNKALNKSAANVLDADSLDKFMQLSKGGFSGEKSLSKNLADIESAAAKAQGSIASLGQELNKLKDEQSEAKTQQDSFKEIEKRYNNYLKLQKQKVAASSFADVKTRYRKKDEVVADYNSLIAQQITEETIKNGDGRIFAQTIGEWLEIEPADIDSFATQSASVIVKTLQDKVSLFLNSTKDGGKGVHALFNKVTEVTGTEIDDSVVKEYTDAKAVTEKYSSQSDYNEKIEKLQNSIKEATELINLINSLKAELEAAAKSHAEAVNKEYDDIIDKQKKEVNRLNERDKEFVYQKINAAGGERGVGAYYNLYNEDSEEIALEHQAQADAAKAKAEADAFKHNLQQSVKHWMGAQQVINLVKQGIRQAYQDIQGLDKAMTNIAVVTDFSVSDLWGKINEYMSIAQQYGVTTQGVYEVSQLYFQQGLGEAETMELTTETLKMARIAGMDYADAADGMTVAIRGFKMEMEDAARVTDVYSKVAAVTASDSQEIIEAMSKTASSAASVGSGFEETTAMLAVMIEATREAPTNIGSAMKSIISRYGEMTKGMTVDTDGEEIAFNKVDTALQSVGVSIKDATGQFREFDDVIYELAGKWETLDSLSQRYVATVFAGNRQQSRFLALMSNYDRLVEVTEDAQNSEDAGLLQYSKTLDSLETKLNNIKTSFQQFYMDIFNGPVIGAGLEFINNLIKGFNKLGKVTSIFNIVNIVKGIKQLANIGVNSFSGIGSSITQSIKNGFSQATLIAFQAGKEHKQAYQSGWNNGAAPTTQNQTSVFAGKGKALVNMAIIGGGALSAVGSAWSSKNAIAGSITSGIGNIISGAGQGAIMGASLGSILGPHGAAIGAVVAGVANALGSIPGIVEAFNNRLQEKADQAAEKAEKSNIKRAEAKEKVRGLEDGIKDLEELSKKRFDSDEDMQAWLDANNALFEKFPELAVKFDEAGNSIVSLTSAEAELTAARKAASDAARQAAADEYDKAITDKKVADQAVADFGKTGIFDSSVVKNTTSFFSDIAAIETLNRVWIEKDKKKIIQKNHEEKDYIDSQSTAFKQLLKSDIDFSDPQMAEWAYSLKDADQKTIIQALLTNLGLGTLKFKEEGNFDSVLDSFFYNPQEIRSGYNSLLAKQDAANRYVDATRASKIAAESASILSGVEEQYEELESANEAIQAQIIKQFSFDEQGKKITGEIDSNKIVEASQKFGEEFTKLYISLFNSGKVDEFNDLIQKALTGNITKQDFKAELVNLDVGQDIINAYINYVEDSILLSPADFVSALNQKEKAGSRELKYRKLALQANKLTEQNRTDIINNEIEFLEAQIEAGKITATQASQYATAYADQISAFGGNQNFIDIFTSGDLTSLKGIQDTEAALQKAGWSGTLEWSQFISTAMINFITSYESLMEGVANSVTKTTELFDKASGEMDIEAAQEIAGALGKDVSIFDTTYFERIGESFYATNEAINALIDQQTKDIDKEITNYTSALQTELDKINNFQEKPETSFYEQYRDTAETALKWAKEQKLTGYESIESAKDIPTIDLKALITEYYSYLQTTAIEGAEKYIAGLEAQLKAEFNLAVTGRNAKSNMVADGIKGLGNKVQVGQEELAYALLAKLSQDITSSLNEAEYALFVQLFGEDYLVADGAGDWQVDITKSNEFIEKYKNDFGTFASNLIYNSFTSLEEKIDILLSDAASLGEEIGKGKIFDINDFQILFEPLLGKLETTIWEQLLAAFLVKDWGNFQQILVSNGIKVDAETAKAILNSSNEMSMGLSRGIDEYTQDIIQAKYDYISGELSSADIKNLAEGTDEEKAYKTQLIEFAEKTGEWALLTLEQQYNVLDEVLASDATLTDKERFKKRESERKRLLEESQGQTLVDYRELRDEAYNLIAKTGGKGLTPEEVASLESIYGELDKVATLDGWKVALPQANAKVQDALLKYRETISQNAADGAEQLLSAMAEGTLTGTQIQDYFEGLDIDVDYVTAENLANGTLEGLLESIKTSLADSNIDVSDKMNEIMAAVMDAILNSISSGISSLGSGLEGTLSAADYQSLAKKYGLTGVGTSKSSKGVRLGAADQQKLISQLYMEAASQGLQAEFGDQIWEAWRDSTEDAFEGYTDIEKAIKAANDQIKELGGETADAAQEAVAYRNALQQARHAAMFDENAAEFAFMEQDATDGLTKNFDKFVDNIDKVKSSLEGLRDSGEMGYNDFYNIVDYLRNSGMWKEVADNMGIAANSAARDIDSFANTVVSASETIGKVDAKGFAELGIDIGTAATSMADGMNEGLKETARSQIRYLSGLEQMLLALQALENIGDINLDLGISFESSIDGPVDLTLANISKYWQEIMNLGDANLNAKIDISIDNKLKELGAGGFNDFFKNLGFGENFDFITAFFGPDGFTFGSQAETQLASQLGQLASLTKTFTENQWMTLAQDMSNIFKSRMQFDPETGLFSGFDFGEGGIEALIADINNFLANYNFSNVKESLNAALSQKVGLMTSGGKTEIPLETSGYTLKPEGDGFKIEGLTEEILNTDAKQAILQDLSKIVGQLVTDIKLNDDGTIDIFGENGLIDTSGIEKINTDFQTAAEAASTLQTAITQISTVASSFQAGSGFQSLADQLNAAASAAKELISALTGQEIESPDISALQAELVAAQAYLDSLNPFSTDAEGNAIQVDYAQLDAAEEKVKSLQTQLKSLQGPPTGVASGIIGELEKATNIANKLSEALSNNNGTPLEVNFNADDANGQVTVLITNLLELNKTFEPTITVDDVEAQATIADVLMQLENVHIQNPTPIVDITDKASAVLESIIGLINSINSKTVTITTIHKDIYMTSFSRGGGGGDNQSYSMRWTGTANDITGPARAGGTVGNLQKGAQLANKTLVGELGPELAVYDGKYHLLGESGAEFVKLPKSAIVFNHLQTAGILSGQMKNARGEPLTPGGALATGNVTGPAAASGIAGALAAVRRAKSVWQGLLNSLSAADLMGGGGGGGGGGGDDNSLKAHIADLQEWYNLSRQIADIEGQINILLAKRKSITDGHEYLRNLRETQRLLDDQVNTQQDLLRFQELQLQRQAEHINNNKIWSQFLQVDENGLLQYKKGNETNGGKGALEVLQQMNEMSGSEQLAFVQSLGWSYTNTDGEELEDEELVAKFFEELQKQIDDYDALRDTVVEAEEALADLEEEINEIEREIRDNEIDLSKEIYDIIVDAWKENIENLKEQNDLIKEANEAYANGIQEAIDAERRMYEQNTAISDREQLQRQLALMRRSGGSASEIADLEQQLDDMLKEEYFSNQEKQLETIQKANERQAELLNQQVKIQEEMLEYQQENGVIWQKVYEVMSGTDAEIIDFMLGNSTNFFEQSALQQEDMLTEWAKKIGIYTEERQRQNYTAEAEKTFDSVWDTETGEKLQEAYNQADSKDQQTWKREYNDTYASKRLEGMTYEEASKYAQNEFYEHIQNWLKAQEDEQNQQDSGSNNNNNSNNSTKGRYETVTYWQAYGRVGNSQGDKKVTGPRTTNGESAARQALKANNPAAFNIQVSKWTVQEWRKYAKGGIIDFTGPAWVDGSKSKPERILSAEQNKILEEGLAMNAGRSDKLKDMFADFATILGSSIRESITNIATNTSSQAITIQPGAIQLNISQLNDSYDVDELFNDVADRLYSIAARASSRGVRRR